MDPLKTLSIVFILVVFLFSACSEEDEFKPYLKGDIVGYAFCFDEYGRQLKDCTQTLNNEMWFPNTSDPHEVMPETLGKPSEVFAFTLDEIIRDF